MERESFPKEHYYSIYLKYIYGIKEFLLKKNQCIYTIFLRKQE